MIQYFGAAGGYGGGNGSVFGGGGGGGLGGAIFAYGGTLTITGSTFNTNHAKGGVGAAGADNGSGQGGAIFVDGRTCVFGQVGNYTSCQGEDAHTTVANSTLTANTADTAGGAIVGLDTSTSANTGMKVPALDVTSTTVDANVAPTGAGLNLVCVDNPAGDLGSAVANGNPNCTLANPTVSPPTTLTLLATIGNDVVAADTATAGGSDVGDIVGPVTSAGGNVVGNPVGALGLNPTTDRTGTAAAPLDPKLGPLAANGGPTPTQLPGPGSPVLGAGAAAMCPPVDQRGLPRSGPCDAGSVQVPAPTGGSYVPLAPSRIADSRFGQGGISKLGAGQAVTVTMPASVPQGATAAALSVTATDATSPGYLSVYPTAAGPPPLESSLNFVAGPALCSVRDCVVPNLVITKLSAANQVSIYNGSAGTVDVVVDLEGYFNAASATTSGAGHYYGLSPARVADTRCSASPAPSFCPSENLPALNAHPKLGPDQSFDVAVGGQGGVPAVGAAAAVVQLTATNTSAMSYLSAYPAGTARPETSNVNFVAGQTTSTRAIVPLSSSGAMSIYNNAGSADVAVDVVGYLSDASGALTGGSLFNPVVPSRVADTRVGRGPYAGATLGPNSSETIGVAGVGGIPASVNGNPTSAALNVTESRADAPMSFLTVTPNPLVPPATTSDVNFTAGEIRANADLAGLAGSGATPGSLSVYNYAGQTDFIIDTFGYFTAATGIQPPP
ncbi:MAG: hypothetical protein M3063_06925 [Actinomycetota bacterium]|nr:hypothetical protein [Actinomycetota bacterium]